ncbi:MAG: hypothetical protein IJJ76_05045 [Ruminococcus sp.]|uniref:hypothetical protein n=1 Tax=Ruminococcus sp. TaxID=41978 RepID=UPI0025EDA2F1|nr:hypothetical protein [Ruminococcus sp.]MBR0529116.1 hypothetical protein [Ruminococcus sp.]
MGLVTGSCLNFKADRYKNAVNKRIIERPIAAVFVVCQRGDHIFKWPYRINVKYYSTYLTAFQGAFLKILLFAQISAASANTNNTYAHRRMKFHHRSKIISADVLSAQFAFREISA